MPDVNRIIFERLVVDGPFGIRDGPITMFPVPVNHVNNLHRGFNRFDFVAFVTHFGRNCCECIFHDIDNYLRCKTESITRLAHSSDETHLLPIAKSIR